MSTAAATWGPRPRETVFGPRLVEAREARGWTIERFAHHCRVSVSTAESWLGDECEPLLAYAFKAACALGYDVEDLADPSLTGPLERRRADAPGAWTFGYKDAVGSTLFGATLRLVLIQRGRTFKDFALDVGVPRSAVTKWVSESDAVRSEPRLTSAMRAADELGLSLHGLCEGRIRQRGGCS